MFHTDAFIRGARLHVAVTHPGFLLMPTITFVIPLTLEFRTPPHLVRPTTIRRPRAVSSVSSCASDYKHLIPIPGTFVAMVIDNSSEEEEDPDSFSPFASCDVWFG
ncbi:protein FAM13A-like [Sesbania bispinosa]|nr:protein FAM13A-like [Sesbania bispinosa]